MSAARSHSEWHKERERYTWHMRPPFKDKFDRSHWWKGESKMDPIAALYELARRHPLIGEAWTVGHDEYFDESVALCWTFLNGLKTWPKLSRARQQFWRQNAGNMKGVDCRPDVQQCVSITSQSSEVFFRESAEHPHAAKQWAKIHEEIIAQQAVSAHRKGYVLLAVAPDLKMDKAQAVMTRSYREHLGLRLTVKQRARWKEWLPIISEFESDEGDKGGAKSKVFNRYRRVMDGLSFPPDSARV